jgi:hypothetical protein
MIVSESKDLGGQVGAQYVTAGTIQDHGVINADVDGVYDVWASADTHIKVSTGDGTGLTALTGYLIRANTTVGVLIRKGLKLASLSGGAGTLNVHKVG